MRLVKPCSVKRFFDSTEHSEVELVSSTKEKRHRKKGEKAKKRSRQKIIHSPARELALWGEKGKTESPSTTKEPKGRVVLTCTGVCSTTSSVNNLSYVKQNSWESSSKQVMPRNLSRRQLRSQGALREDLLQSISPIVPPTSFSLSFTREVLGLFTAHRGTQKPQGKGSLDWHVHTECVQHLVGGLPWGYQQQSPAPSGVTLHLPVLARLLCWWICLCICSVSMLFTAKDHDTYV